MSRKVNTSYTPAQVKAAFKVFEKEAPSGFVTMAALEQALTTYGSEKLSLSDAQELLSQIEPDESGLINYVEFVNMSAQHTPHARTRPYRFFFEVVLQRRRSDADPRRPPAPPSAVTSS